MAWQAGQGTICFGMARRDLAGLGMAGVVWRGGVWHGPTGLGLARQAGQVLAWPDEARRGTVWQAGSGEARYGLAG